MRPDAEAPAVPDRRGPWMPASLREGFVFVLKVFLGVRIVLFVLGLLSPGL